MYWQVTVQQIDLLTSLQFVYTSFEYDLIGFLNSFWRGKSKFPFPIFYLFFFLVWITVYLPNL